MVRGAAMMASISRLSAVIDSLPIAFGKMSSRPCDPAVTFAVSVSFAMACAALRPPRCMLGVRSGGKLEADLAVGGLLVKAELLCVSGGEWLALYGGLRRARSCCNCCQQLVGATTFLTKHCGTLPAAKSAQVFKFRQTGRIRASQVIPETGGQMPQQA